MPAPCVISQPTFLPWCGYFDLIDQAREFVFLDQVQFAKRSWQQRNRIVTTAGLTWLTVPALVAGKRSQSIGDVEISSTADFPRKVLRTLEHEYRKAPHFSRYFPPIAAIFEESAADGLAELNMQLIRHLCATLGIATPLVVGSALGVEGRRSELLIGLCRAVDNDRYLSARGAGEYLAADARLFAAAGIAVELQSYEHPEYPQLHSPFTPYAAVVDLLFNVGEDALEVIRSGRRENVPLEAVS